MKKKVIVLMSTYNGERHLVEQIESILNQEGVDVRLMIRDDGSNDKTVEIARKYTDDVVVGDNIGFRYSFLELIKNAPEAEYYALADQDDIWLPENSNGLLILWKGQIQIYQYYMLLQEKIMLMEKLKRQVSYMSISKQLLMVLTMDIICRDVPWFLITN